jgi:hypothetical protein
MLGVFAGGGLGWRAYQEGPDRRWGLAALGALAVQAAALVGFILWFAATR